MRAGKLKMTVSVTLEIDQLQRLDEVARQAQVSRSTIARRTIERELRRYERSHPQEAAGKTPPPFEEGIDEEDAKQ
jgi:predicted transcriptional regulator